MYTEPQKYTLRQILRQTINTGLEVVALVKHINPLSRYGKKLAILKIKDTPIAFVMRNLHGGSTHHSLAFKLKNGKSSSDYYLQCACASCSRDLPDASKRKFKKNIEKVCHQHGVNLLLMRHGSYWDQEIGKMENVTVADPDDKVVEEYWRYRESIREALGVIDWRHSNGQGGKLYRFTK